MARIEAQNKDGTPTGTDVLKSVQVYFRADQEILNWINELARQTGLSASQVIRSIILEVKSQGVIVERPIRVIDPKAENENHTES